MLGSTSRFARLTTRAVLAVLFLGLVTVGVTLPAGPASADVCSATAQYEVDCTGQNFDGLTVNFSAGPTYSTPTVDFFGVSAIGAHLTGVAFSSSGGASSNFQSANLADATFSGFQAMWAGFNNANFTGADLSGGNFQSATFSNVSFTGATLLGANLAGANFGSGTPANITGSDLVPAHAYGASMDGNPVAMTFAIPENTSISDVPGAGHPSCDHPSGSLFPIGTTTVTCTVPSMTTFFGSPIPSAARGTFEVTVFAGPSITTTAIAPFTVGTAGSVTLTGTGGGTPTWDVYVGTLPAGLSLDPGTGVIAGTPVAGTAGSSDIEVSLLPDYGVTVPGASWDGAAFTVWVQPAVTGVTGNGGSIGSDPYRAGSSIQIIAEGYLEDTVVEIWLNSTPVLLGTQTIGPDGRLSLMVTIPSNVTAGAHSISLIATAPGGAPLQTLAYPVTVTRAGGGSGGSLAATGYEIPGGLTGLAVLAIAAGALALTRDARRLVR